MIAVRFTLTVSLLLVAANAHPHHQLIYQQQAPPSGYYYVPQADASSVSSVQRYAAPVPVALQPGSPAAPGAPQYVLLYPDGGGLQNNFVYGRAGLQPRGADEPEDANRPTIWNLFNIFQRPTTTPKVEAAEDEVTTPKVQAAEDEVTTAKTIVTSTAATTVEETTPNSSDEASVKPEKIVTDKDKMMAAVEQLAVGFTDQQKASLENLDENLPQTPPQFVGSPSSDGRQFTLVQRPQFFGNYDFLNRGGMHQRFGLPPGAVSDFLLFRNGFSLAGPMPAPVQPGRPLKQMEIEPVDQIAHVVPGSAALAFQQHLKDAQQKDAEANGVDTEAVSADGTSLIPGSKHVDVSQLFGQSVHPHFYVAPSPGSPLPGLVSFQHTVLPNQQSFSTFQRQVAAPGVVNVGPGYQNVFLVSPAAPGAAVVIESDQPRRDDMTEVEAEQAGPSVAQAKPQAIALAGAGGVAAASPVATAVVGPGGLAVSAPTATAVAGPSGGSSLVGPALAAVNKHVTNSGKVKTSRRDETSYDATYEEDNAQ